ncbi:hypothetical protein D3C76_1297380 [compost metagenome]
MIRLILPVHQRRGLRQFLRRHILAGQILVEGAAQHHIEHLKAPADSQKRFVKLQRTLNEIRILLIPLRANFLAALQHRLSVQGGIHIMSARNQQPVHFPDQLL